MDFKTAVHIKEDRIINPAHGSCRNHEKLYIPDKKQLFPEWQLISEKAFHLRNQQAFYKEEMQKQQGDRKIGGKRIWASMGLPIIEIGNM